jgi:exosortase A
MNTLLTQLRLPPRTLLNLLPGVLVVLCLTLLFRDTVAEMIATYGRSETFAHAYLVPLISAWLIWRQRFALANTPVKPAPGVLVLMAGAALLWLVGELAVVNAATQFAFVSLLILTVPVVYGFAVTRVLLFPLLFLYFAVPIGLFLLPVMMEHTANFTVAALQVTGIPVYREGLQFVIPSGSWSVVEACSGVRYLIASFMVGTLFAYLNYTSWKRRLLFVVVSIVVPIVANWLRAYMIVMLGHLSGNRLAVGVDHLIYGWVFFGLVIGVMFMIGAKWAQPHDPVQYSAQEGGASPALAALPAEAAKSLSALWATAAAAVVVMLSVHAALWSLDSPRADALKPLKLPQELGAEWKPGPDSITPWVPAFSGARSIDQRVYLSSRETEGVPQAVAVWAAHYREQGRQNKLVSSSNALSRVEESQWAQVSTGSESIVVGGQELLFKTALLRGPGAPGSAAAQRLLVWQIYWLGGDTFSASDVRAKLLLAMNRLRARGDDSAVLIFFAEAGNSAKSLEDAQAALRRLVGAELTRFSAPLKAMEPTGH